MRMSWCSHFWYAAPSSYHLLLHVLMTPTRKPYGWVFCPMDLVLYLRSSSSITMWEMPLVIRVARPIARGRQRRLNLFGPLSTAALLTKSASTSAPSWRALATALSMILRRIGAPLFCVNWSSWIASAASRPRTRSAIMRAFRGAIRENLALALLPIREPSRSRRRDMLADRLSVPDEEPVEPSYASAIQPDVVRFR